MNAFISGRVTSNQQQAFGLDDKFAFAYLFVSFTNRSQTSGVKNLLKRSRAVLPSGKCTVGPGIRLEL